MIPPRLRKTASAAIYAFLVLVTICVTLLTCVFFLTQAIRTSPTESFHDNFNALVIGASYTIVAAVSVLFCMKRRIAIRLKLQRISKSHRMISKGDVPNPVHEYLTQEYTRTCLIAFDSQPKDVHHEGWGQPGSKYGDIYFRRALLDTIPEIDRMARSIIPTQPPLKSHARMLHHFRFLLPLLKADEDNLTPLHYYDSVIQLARDSSREPTESEFEVGMEAKEEIMDVLQGCWYEMLEASSTKLAESSE